MSATFDFVILYVSDMDETLRLFTQQLGFTHEQEADEPSYRQIDGGAGNTKVGIVQAGAQTPPPGSLQLFFQTEDLAGLREELIAKGVEASPISQRPFGKVFSVTTPDGVPLQMMRAND